MSTKWSLKRKVGISLLAVIAVTAVLLYINFNRLVSEAVMISFNSNIISDVYELKFEKLRVNILKGDVRVVNVVIQPREKPLREYPYINSSLRLSAERINLIDVQLLDLLKSGGLFLKEISIRKPHIELDMAEAYPNFFPFNDTIAVETHEAKKALSLSLTKFNLEDATIRVVNAHRQTDTDVERFNLMLDNLLIDQKPATNVVSFSRIDLALADFKRVNRKGPIRRSSFSQFQIGVDSFMMQSTKDTVTFGMTDFTSGISNLDMHTADSLFHITMGSFSSSYKEGRIRMGELSFTPNMTNEEMQARFKYQKVHASGKIGTVDIRRINFDSLIYHRSLLIDSILIDKPELSVFKDKTKPLDTTRFPTYLGQQVGGISMPLRIRSIVVSDVHLLNTEIKPDSTYAKVTIERGTVHVTNVNSLSKAAPLVISANAFLIGKIPLSLRLAFSYEKPQFDFSGTMGKFDLPQLNPVLSAYTPATISAGVAEDMVFSGTADWTSAAGTMKFLYTDLAVDLALKDQAKWKSSVVAFAANTIVTTSNPGGQGLPPREVTFHAARDMNKGFVNIIVKSMLNGVKETLIMSKENRAAYNAARKKQRKESQGGL